MDSPLSISFNNVLPNDNHDNSSITRKRRTIKLPIIDTTKLLSLEVKQQHQPLMDALLSPTSLEARLRQTTRVLKHDFEDATEHAMQFQKEIDDLAEEAEQVGEIGPIVLPDEPYSADEANPNKIGWVDIVFGEEIEEENKRQLQISQVRSRHYQDVMTKIGSTDNQRNRKVSIPFGCFGFGNGAHGDDDDNEGDDRIPNVNNNRRKSSVFHQLPQREFTQNFREQQSTDDVLSGYNHPHSILGDDDDAPALLKKSSSQQGSAFLPFHHGSKIISTKQVSPSLSSTSLSFSQRPPVVGENTGGIVLLNGAERANSLMVGSQATSNYSPTNSHSNDGKNIAQGAGKVHLVRATSSASLASSRQPGGSSFGTAFGSIIKKSSLHDRVTVDGNEISESSVLSPTSFRKQLEMEHEREELLFERRKNNIPELFVQDVESDEDDHAHDDESQFQTNNSNSRNDLERAQMAIVEKIRFVPPRSVAPSQLSEVIKATCSVSKSADDDDDLEVPLYPSLNEEAEKQWRSRVWNQSGKYSYAPSKQLQDRDAAKMEKKERPSLAELLAQQKEMMVKLDKERPEYERMMDHSVALLQQQKKAMEERYALIS